MGNFDFLKDEYPELATFGNQADAYRLTDPNASLIKENATNAAVNTALATITTLRKAILVRALRGEPVTNDPPEASSFGLPESMLANKGGAT